MRSTTSWLVTALLQAGLAAAIPANPSGGGGGGGNGPNAAESPTHTCTQWGKLETSSFLVVNDLWGKDSASPGGYGCVTVTGSGAGEVNFNSAWSWQGAQSNVKSYPSAVFHGDDSIGGMPISQLPSIPSTFSWTYSGTGLDCDVAYDLFLGDDKGYLMDWSSAYKYELMIWLAAKGGAMSIGADKPAIEVTIGGQKWNLFIGSNGQQQVFSYVPPSATEERASFSGDLAAFIKQLVTLGKLDGDKVYLKHIAAGSEPFVGTDALFSAKLSVSVGGGGGGSSGGDNHGGSHGGETPSTTSPSTSSPTPTAASNKKPKQSGTTVSPNKTKPTASPKPTSPPLMNSIPPSRDVALSAEAGTTVCDQWGKIDAPSFQVQNDMWGMDKATSGGACVTLLSSTGDGSGDAQDTVQFKSNWTWAGGHWDVKSWPNAAWRGAEKYAQTKITSLPSIYSSLKWDYTGTGVTMDVIWDFYLGPAPGYVIDYSDTFTHELMVWIGRTSDVNPTGTSKQVTLKDGSSWTAYKTSNGKQQVGVFVSSDPMVKFYGHDMTEFIKLAVTEGLLPEDLYLKHFSAGMEPYLGNDVHFQMTVTAGGDASTDNGGSSSGGGGGGGGGRSIDMPTNTTSSAPASTPTPSAGGHAKGCGKKH